MPPKEEEETTFSISIGEIVIKTGGFFPGSTVTVKIPKFEIQITEAK